MGEKHSKPINIAFQCFQVWSVDLINQTIKEVVKIKLYMLKNH